MFKQFFNKSENKKREEDKNKVEVFKKEIKNKEYIKEKEEIKQFINEEIETLKKYIEKQFDICIEDSIKYSISKNIKDTLQDLTKDKFYEKFGSDISGIKKSISSVENHRFKISDRDKSDIRVIANECISNQIKPLKSELNKLEKISKIQEDINTIRKEYRKLNAQIEDINDIKNHIEKMNESLESVTKTVELLQGKMNYLDSINDLKESIEKIAKKPNTQENVASNLEEEVIINLGQYGEKIVKELTNTARCYAQNKDSIESIHNERSEYERKILDAREKSKSDGIEIGKLETIKEIINKNDGIDELFDSEDPFKKVISDMLRNNGFSRDEELKINKEITITEENIEKIGRKASNITIGRYIVIKSAIILNGEVYKDAVLNKIDNN